MEHTHSIIVNSYGTDIANCYGTDIYNYDYGTDIGNCSFGTDIDIIRHRLRHF